MNNSKTINWLNGDFDTTKAIVTEIRAENALDKFESEYNAIFANAYDESERDTFDRETARRWITKETGC